MESAEEGAAIQQRKRRGLNNDIKNFSYSREQSRGLADALLAVVTELRSNGTVPQKGLFGNGKIRMLTEANLNLIRIEQKNLICYMLNNALCCLVQQRALACRQIYLSPA